MASGSGSGRRIAQQLLGVVGRAALQGAQSWLRQRGGGSTSEAPRRSTGSRGRPGGSTRRAPRPAPAPPAGTSAYPGDFEGVPSLEYSPQPDGRPDPGEVVWTWVPYEEDHSQGKDRPVLLVGRDGDWLLALQLTSKDHDRDEEQEARAGRYWVDIGTGAWDAKGRPSEVRVNRVIRVDPGAIRREGAVLPRERFGAVAAGVRAHA